MAHKEAPSPMSPISIHKPFAKIRPSRITPFLFCSFLCLTEAPGQPTNLGDPLVMNFYKKDIQSGTQTWDITEDARGYTYFANNSGLLVFDGYNWELYPLPNGTIVRSIAIDPLGRIFVGGQGEFGYFSPRPNGTLRYHSLLPLILENNSSIEDVWDIQVAEEGVFFRTDNQIFRYDGKRVFNLFGKGRPLNFISKWGNYIVVQDGANQLYYFDQTSFKPRAKNQVFDKGRISGVLNLPDGSVLITTINNGIYLETPVGFEPWQTDNDEFLRKNIIYCSALMPDGRVLIGTSFNGMVIIDRQKRIEQHLNKKNGLQNNTVLSIAGDHNGNIWLGLDNGLDLVGLNSPFRTYFPDGELEGAGSTAALFKDRLYFGTNGGLYTIPWKKHYLLEEKGKAQLIPNTRGQVWGLNHIGEQLLMGHHNGAFQIEDASSTKISDLMGVWKFVPIDEQHALAGYYKGLILFEKQGTLWKQKHVSKNFAESSRIISLDAAQNIWIDHPYRGVFMIPRQEALNPDVKPRMYSHQNDLNKTLRFLFFYVDQRILLCDQERFYQYNPITNKSEPYHDLDPHVIPDASIRFLIQDDYQNIWYGNARGSYLLAPEKTFNPSYRVYPINEITGVLPGGFESVLTIDKHNVIFPTEKGFLFFDPTRYMEDTSAAQVFLSKAILNAAPDSVFHTGHLQGPLSFKFKKKHNSFTFQFSVKSSGKKDLISYCYFLEGSDQKWSEWTHSPNVVYPKLSPGRYTLRVKAKNQTGIESPPIEISLRITRPWYEYTALVFVGVVIFSIQYIITRLQRKKHEREKSHILETTKKREEEHLIYAEASKEEITRLQNEKLMAEISFKNQELTSFTYHLVNKNELISEINAVVHRLEHKLNDQPEIKKELKQILKLTEKNADVDANWQDFIKSFDQVHAHFYKRLTEEFKDLSPNDYKMCTYLRMNLTSKEIASLMNISIRSVETNRYRLRKKLGIDPSTNLNQFLMNY